MKIQPICNQPKFAGKVVFEKGTTGNLTRYMPERVWRKFKEVANLISEKPYDLFISVDKKEPDFYNISANKSFEEAQKIKEYTVKVHFNAITDSIADASKEAMDMYEKYISRNVKR